MRELIRRDLEARNDTATDALEASEARAERANADFTAQVVECTEHMRSVSTERKDLEARLEASEARAVEAEEAYAKMEVECTDHFVEADRRVEAATAKIELAEQAFSLLRQHLESRG